MKKLLSFLIFSLIFYPLSFSFAATGCNYPSSLDNYVNKVTGDYLTVADINSRSCAIEQLELRLNQVFLGKAGGQTIIGGTGSFESLGLSATSHANKGFITFGASSAFNETTNMLGLGTQNPTFVLTATNSSSSLARFTSTSAGSFGPSLEFYHNSSTPASLDTTAAIRFLANDSGTTPRLVGQITAIFDDVISTTMDSRLLFYVMNNVNAGDAATIASLNSLGQWTNASDEKIKYYEGDLTEALEKLKTLQTLGIYRAKNVSQEKIAEVTRGYGPTAQEFYRVFGLGDNPDKGSPGIAANNAAFIAAKAVLELEARVQALEKR